ncbi:MAG: ribonuclease III [Bacilli bacterium]|nr:ribonuclease III [Bacilli bacterium]
MEELFKKLNISPKNKELYKQAFIHTSYAYENNLDYSYETLEFLGDAILELAVSDYLYRENKFHEGDMTKLRASYVCENALYEYATDLEFNKLVMLGKGELNTGGNYKKAILADIFEAFIAAIYLDLGYEKAKQVVLDIIIPYVENKEVMFFSDYKSELQEAVQDVQRELTYELVNESGPAHDKQFEMAVKIDNIVYGTGEGHTKKEAEQEAAKSALTKLVKDE